MARLAGPLVSPVLVGRIGEIEILRRGLITAEQGAGQLIALIGEAGIGKSRLAAEIAAAAAMRGFLVLQGYCFEQDAAFPYAPIIDLLRTFHRQHDSDDLSRSLGPLAPELGKLAPELAPQIVGLPPSPPLEPEAEKRRLFAVIVQWLQHLGKTQPLLVIMEDLHWSDQTSLDFVHYLARQVDALPLLLLLTYRTEEESPALSRLLTHLDRERLQSEVRLGRLTPVEVESLISSILGAGHIVRNDLLETVYRLTEGNPFFVEEALYALMTAEDSDVSAGSWQRQSLHELRLPRSIRVAVQRRTDQLSPTARATLPVAAVAGRRFSFGLLQQLTQFDEERLLAVLNELIDKQLVVEESAEHFAFRHALTREAIYAGLLVRERQALHRKIAEHLMQHSAGSLQVDQYIADLAYHSFHGGWWEIAFEFCQRAGEKAQSLYAPHEAIDWFTRALHAARNLSLTVPSELHLQRGLAYEIVGEHEQAQAEYEATLHGAAVQQKQILVWQALLGLGQLWATRDYAQAASNFQQALELARTLGDSRMIAASLNRIGNWYANLDQLDSALAHHQEALAIYRQLDDRQGQAQSLDLLGLVNQLRCDVVQSVDDYKQAVRLFRELDDRQGLSSSAAVLTILSGTYHAQRIGSALSIPDFNHEPELGYQIAHAIGWRAGEAYALASLSLYCGTRGDYAKAITLAQRGLEIAQEIEHRQWTAAALCALGILHLDLLAPQTAVDYLEPARAMAQSSGSQIWSRIIAGWLASALVLADDLDRAQTVLDAVLGDDTPAETQGQRICWCARVELALARHEPARALRIIDRVIAAARNAASREVRAIPYLWKLRSVALADLHRIDEAVALLERLRAAAQADEDRSSLWRYRAALSRHYQTAGRAADAQRELAATRSLLAELAVTVPESLREHFLQRAEAMLPRMSTRALQQEFGGLTQREREVAALIAQGHANRAIAEHLVISERTVEGHVSNILSKLGFNTRAKIAVWATEKGLGSKA